VLQDEVAAWNQGRREGRKPPSLPDLKERLIKYGVYNQYLAWSEGYKRWRQGQAAGARGEATVDTLINQQGSEAYRLFYPDEVSFAFRETVSYWISVLLVEGSVLFAASAYLAADWPELSWIPVRITFVGTLCYTLACYLLFFEIINLPIKKGDKLNFIWCDWSTLSTKYGVKVPTWLGGFAYFAGAIMYQIAGTFALLSNWIDEDYIPYLVAYPLIVGGVGFVVGGVCEILLNEVWRPRPYELVWWTSILNSIGDVLFLFSALPIFTEFEMCVLSGVGAIHFLLAGILSLLMWKSEQFGLTLLAQLNAVAKEEGVRVGLTEMGGKVAIAVPETCGHVLGAKSFSPRGALFIALFSLTGAVSAINCCFSDRHPSTGLRDLSITLQEYINVVIVHMVLIMKSAGLHRVPKEQPWRCLVLSLRFVIVGVLLHSLLTIYIFMKESLGKRYPESLQ